MKAIILCGGSGTRLWPLSRKNYPKQFLRLIGKNSLLQDTYLRFRKALPEKNIFFVTNGEHFFHVRNHIREMSPSFPECNILREPKSLNTFPATLFAMRHFVECGVEPDEIFILSPSDHYIPDSDTFVQYLSDISKELDGKIGTVGISPTTPETGYGYIKKGGVIKNSSCERTKKYIVERFHEKPDEEKAREYFQAGKYLWNSGMYFFTLETFRSELQRISPDALALLQSEGDTFAKKFLCRSAASFDTALSEKTKNLIVFEGDFEWSDIGTFDSLAEVLESTSPRRRELFFDSKNVFTHSESGKLIALLGVQDISIIENTDSILVHKRGRSGDVRALAKLLEESGYPELEHNIIVHRPWGRFEILLETENYKVKKLVVLPGAKLSLQVHKHRAEHWIVVSGKAKATIGGRVVLLQKNESDFVLKETKHRLENPGDIPLEMIEVQTGSYLGEDDIVRFGDEYNRVLST